MPQRTRQRRTAPDSPALRQLGERLREARVAAGLSQAQLGAPYYTRAHVSAIELGKIRPAMKSLEHLAAKLGKPPAYFLEDAARERGRRELDLEVDSAASLAVRATAARCADAAGQLLEREGLTARQICRVRIARGRALNFLERSAEALRDLTVAQRLAVQLKDVPLTRAAEYEIAAATRGSGNSRRARELFAELLRTVERSSVPDQLLRVRLLQALGAVSNDLGEPQAAAGYLNSALGWAKDIGDVSMLVAIYHGLAMSFRAQGDLESATAYVQRALAATEVSNDLTAAAIMHNLLAVIAADSGRVQAAYTHADRAIALARAAGPPFYIPHMLATKAESAAKLRDWEMAERVARESLTLAEELRNDAAGAAARVVLSEVLFQKGEPEGGEAQLKEAARAYGAAGAKAELADVLMRLSRGAKARGDIEAAEHFATLAYQAARSTSVLVEVEK